MMDAKRAVVFDLDGTLVDSLVDICGNLNRVRAFYGLRPLSTEAIRPHIGKGAENVVKHTLPEMPQSQITEMTKKYMEFYEETPFLGGGLFPQVRETLQALRSEWGMKLAVATNKPTRSAEVTIQQYLSGFQFEWVAGPELVSEKKPSPKHLLEVLAKLGVPPERAFYVGDDPVDLLCAEAAGVPFFAATYGIGAVRTGTSRDLNFFSELLEKIPRL